MTRKELEKNNAIIMGERDIIDPLYRTYAGKTTYWYYKGDVYVSEYHTNDMTYTGKTSTEWFVPFETLHEQHLRGVYSHDEFGDVLDEFLQSKEYQEIKAVAIKPEEKNNHVETDPELER